MDRHAWSNLFEMLGRLEDANEISPEESALLMDCVAADDVQIIRAFQDNKADDSVFLHKIRETLLKSNTEPRQEDGTEFIQEAMPRHAPELREILEEQGQRCQAMSGDGVRSALESTHQPSHQPLVETVGGMAIHLEPLKIRKPLVSTEPEYISDEEPYEDLQSAPNMGHDRGGDMEENTSTTAGAASRRDMSDRNNLRMPQLQILPSLQVTSPSSSEADQDQVKALISSPLGVSAANGAPLISYDLVTGIPTVERRRLTADGFDIEASLQGTSTMKDALHRRKILMQTNQNNKLGQLTEVAD